MWVWLARDKYDGHDILVYHKDFVVLSVIIGNRAVERRVAGYPEVELTRGEAVFDFRRFAPVYEGSVLNGRKICIPRDCNTVKNAHRYFGERPPSRTTHLPYFLLMAFLATKGFEHVNELPWFSRGRVVAKFRDKHLLSHLPI